MCGIAGIAGFDSQTSQKEAIATMVTALSHRGPDAEGIWESSGVALGHRRLAILDLSDAGKQPMHDPTGRYTIIFNGEIYNYRSIRSELKSTKFTTDTDTEVLLAAFQKWGPSFVNRLNGMFAFTIWDAEKQELFIARDRLGIKPLYYHQKGGILSFASEIRSLIKSGQFRPRLNRAQLGDFIRYQTVNSPATLIEDVLLFPAGATGLFKAGKLSISRYWESARSASGYVSGESTTAVKDRIKDLLSASVERRMIADVPLGAFLSGGIDSSAIVGLMANISERPVDTFSVVFNEKEYDESEWSEMAAKRFATNHHPILLKPASFLEALPDALAAMDHPSGDGVNSYVVSEVTRKAGITVALSGLGGDELFAGYPFFRQLLDLQGKALLKYTPHSLRKLMAGMAQMVPGGRRGQKIADVLRVKDTSLRSIFPVYRRLYSGDLADQILPREAQGTNAVELWLDKYARDLDELPVLSQISAAEIDNYMQHILLRDTDQMSMAHALEVRVPFLDHELVEYVLAIPDSVKFPHYPKQLLVEAMGDLLPDEIVHRKKMGFTFPWADWLRNELSSFAQKRLDFLEEKAIFRPGSVKGLWNRFEKGDNTVIWAHIWLLVVLADWMDRNEIEA